MRKIVLLFALFIFFLNISEIIAQPQHFSTSIHKTRIGKATFYDKENGGFETLTNVPIEDMGCIDCHAPTNALGIAYDESNPWTGMTCLDCHNGSPAEGNVSQDQCLACHGRQAAEIGPMNLSDVHRTAGFKCWDCHGTEDMHGDGTVYESMLADGATDADCADCHTAESIPDHTAYDPHGGKLHCTTCHAETVITCYNCHLESQVEHHVKRAKQKVKGFMILVNREKDGKVYPATFQSLSHDGNSWIAMGPYTSHSIKSEGRTCEDCHNSENVQNLVNTGELKFATWSDTDSSLSTLTGIVPLPEDYATNFKMDFIKYDGNTSDPAAASKNWSKIGKDVADGFQLKYATALTSKQIKALNTNMDMVANFETSIHKTRAGKPYWYDKENGGFETLTGVPIEEMGCVECHSTTDANGVAYDESNPFVEMSCKDCHANNEFSAESVSQEHCLTCHGRQAAEMGPMNLTDVHRTAGFVCWDCHTSEDMHGDGTVYSSMLEDGAIDADCSTCHTEESLPAGHSDSDPHDGKLHCTTCHAETVITCYNCHLESQVEHHVKRAKAKVKGFMILVNREKDNKVYPATFQSLSHDGNSWIAMGPYTSHSIQSEGRVCADCHGSENVTAYKTNGELKFATWNEADSSLATLTGIIPLPKDYATKFKMDFIKYDGNTSDPAGPSNNWSKIGKDVADGFQLDFATPLTDGQITALSIAMDEQSKNFATSLHGTRAGKPTWYDKENGGFETLTNVPIEEMGCVECHAPTDANGDIVVSADYEPGCIDCHATKTDFSVNQETCLSCHGRQSAEVSMGLSNVHMAADMKCWDCHSSTDIHGDGNEYESMLADGAMTADCESCHIDGNTDFPNAPAPKHNGTITMHLDKVHCLSCHAETVITCYNCHLESQVEHHVKRAKTKLKDFMILVNREKDGKVYPASFQSATYQGNAWIAMGPFTPHTVSNEPRACNECHQNFGGDIEAIKEYNETGEITFATWSDTDSSLVSKKGIIPLPTDYERAWKMSYIKYDGNTSDPAAPSNNWSSIGKDKADGFQLLYATALTKVQMAKLGYDTTKTVTSVDDELEKVLPNDFELEQNYPNPFNPTTTISYQVPSKSRITIRIYDALGELVGTLVDEEKAAGRYSVIFNAGDLASGIYFYKLETTTGFEATKKLMLLK
ncbi:MAG: T9SS type A sorting domain-containing protein [Melioribacteraceae bacterium]|nr:T9SS type A sorting domain-containing protein [Melioribacteraceae bacterium]